MSSKGRQAKLTAFLAKPQDGSSPKKNKQRSTPPRPRQARLDSLPGVVKLPKMSGHANDAELHRLLDSMDPSSSAEDIIQAMKQAACYEFSVDQVRLACEHPVLAWCLRRACACHTSLAGQPWSDPPHHPRQVH